MARFIMDGAQRKRLRWADHDYSRSNIYFITIRTHENAGLFGRLDVGGLEVNLAGRMVSQEWRALQDRFPRVSSGLLVIMPDHIHGILSMHDVAVDDGSESYDLPRVMQAYKSLTTKRYIEGVRDLGWPNFNGKVWQKSYHDRIVRSKNELDAIVDYIRQNPRRLWVRVHKPPQTNHE